MLPIRLLAYLVIHLTSFMSKESMFVCPYTVHLFLLSHWVAHLYGRKSLIKGQIRFSLFSKTKYYAFCPSRLSTVIIYRHSSQSMLNIL